MPSRGQIERLLREAADCMSSDFHQFSAIRRKLGGGWLKSEQQLPGVGSNIIWTLMEEFMVRRNAQCARACIPYLAAAIAAIHAEATQQEAMEQGK